MAYFQQKLLTALLLLASARCQSTDTSNVSATPTITLAGTLPDTSNGPGSISRTLPFVGASSGPGLSGGVPGLSGSLPGLSGSIPGESGTIGPGGLSGCVLDVCGSISNPYATGSGVVTTTVTGPLSTTDGTIVPPQLTSSVATIDTSGVVGGGSTTVATASVTVVPTAVTTLSGATETLYGTETLGGSGTEETSGASVTATAGSSGTDTSIVTPTGSDAGEGTATQSASSSSASPFLGGARPAAEVIGGGSGLGMVVALLGVFGLL